MFVDQAVITVKAGHGGAGHVSFRRGKYEPKGGPSGGDGGRGGDVTLEAQDGLNTLLDFRGRPEWSAQDGGTGGKKQCFGSDGRDCLIGVPAGTLVFDNLTGDLIVDMAPHQRFTICVAGNGGFGNEHYKNAANQSPTHFHPGFPGQEREVRLELKLLADVGLVGKPNAGKSTLLAALTKAHPKIANYPFTTLAPQLGVAELDPTRRIVLADIPGLIEGASEGAGLGTDFLRHIERTRVLVHLLDAVPEDGTNPADNYTLIRKELYAYSPVLAERDELIVLNKLDLLPSKELRDQAVADLRAKLKLGRDVDVIGISAAARMNTRPLLERLWAMVKNTVHTWNDEAPAASEALSAQVTTPKAVAIPAWKKAAKASTTPAKPTTAATARKVPGVKAAPAPAPFKAKPAAKTQAAPKPKSKPAAKPATKPVAKPAAKSTPAPKAKANVAAKKAGPQTTKASSASTASKRKPAAKPAARGKVLAKSK